MGPPQVIDLPVFIPAWVYDCCGTTIRCGERRTVELTLIGETAPTDATESITVNPDGTVTIVATAVRPLEMEADGLSDSGTLLRSGPIEFAVLGEVAAGQRCCCTGYLIEERHGAPVGRTHGTIAAIGEETFDGANQAWVYADVAATGLRASAAYREELEWDSASDIPSFGEWVGYSPISCTANAVDDSPLEEGAAEVDAEDVGGLPGRYRLVLRIK